MYGIFNPYSLFGCSSGIQLYLEANADFTTTQKNTNLVINPLDNDTSDTTLDSITTAPQYGTATINGNTIEYTPNSDYVGQDVIKYKIVDADGNEDESSIFIYVADTMPEPTACDNSDYKCKIIANKDSQGVAIIFDSNITTTIANASGGDIELNNGSDIETISNGESKEIKCGSEKWFELYKLYNAKIEVHNIAEYPISFDDNAVPIDIYNKTGSDKYIYRDSNGQVISDNGSYVRYNHCKFVDAIGNENNTYQEPTRPVPPIPAHYSDISLVALTDYMVKVTATSDFDVNISNVTSADIIPKDNDGNDLSVLSNNTSTVYTQDVMFSSGGYLTYTEPTRPTPPTPAHYSDVELHLIDYGISLTATTDEDTNIVNKFTDNIKIFKYSDNSQLSDLSTDGSYVVIDNVKITPNDGNYKTYIEPVRPTPPTPANYSNFTVVAISDNIDVTATNSEDCDIINSTGGDINVGATAVANGNNIVITENTTLSNDVNIAITENGTVTIQ